MTIVNTFISDENTKIPPYTYYSLAMLREKNPYKKIYFISNSGHGFDNIFKNLNIYWINQNDIPKTQEMIDLGKSPNTDHLMGKPDTQYPSNDKFFYRAMERIFYLASFAQEEELFNFYHFENDVLTYYKLPDIMPGSYVTPMGPNLSTFAFCFFDNYFIPKEICKLFLEYLSIGQGKFCSTYNVDMLNEMTMLAAAKDVLKYRLKYLPILPKENVEYIFDPGSYGQYLYGTNNKDHGKGYAGDHHYIGSEIINNKIKVYIKNGLPYCNETKIFNLHIHSKLLSLAYDNYRLYHRREI